MPTAVQPLTLIFPMAGKSAHAGYKYKPFLTIDEETLVEAALRPFLKWKSRIGRLVFITLEEQETEFAVNARLHELFPGWDFDLVRLERPTEGPAATLAQAVEKGNISGPAIVCDCDHSIDVDPLMERIATGGPLDCAFPWWSLSGENLKNWSVAACNPDGTVTAIAEKQVPAARGDFVGVIGCYYFADIRAVAEIVRERKLGYLSQAIVEWIDAGKVVKAVPVSRAEFFGDTRGLRQARARRDRFPGTIFCDLDGTVIEHQDQPTYDLPVRLLPGGKEKLDEWMSDGYLIVLTTARPQTEQEPLEQALRQAAVPFHRLMMGLPSGPRYAINDRKPSAMFVPQVVSFEVSRNEGIAHIALPSIAPSVLKRFHGASFADTLLLEDDEKLFVRKRVLKREHLTLGYAKLRSQYRTLERFAQFGHIVPGLYGEHDNSLEYYYDMEYLAKHRSLPHLPPAELQDALAKVFDFFQDRVYAVKTSTNRLGEDWLLAHFARKIFPKLDAVQSYPPLAKLVNADEVRIDERTYPGLRSLLSAASDSKITRWLAPKWLSAVHGDLTFENVLYHADDVRVIDTDGGDFLDAPELDLGKLFQSLIARYEEWAHTDARLCEFTEDGQLLLKTSLSSADESVRKLCLGYWSQILSCSEEQAYVKGLFYMGLHLIRMVPFRLRVSEEQAVYALATAIKFMGDATRSLSSGGPQLPT